MGTGYHGGFGNTNGAAVQKEINIQKEISNEVPQTSDVKKELINELIHNNVKISVDDVVFITRDNTNQIV